MATSFETKLRTDLEARRAALLHARSRNLTEESELLSERATDPIDVGAERAAARVLDTLAESERQEVLRIDAALVRMAAGTYGACEHCGEWIDAERLEAVPEALFCVDCEDAARPSRPLP